VNWSRSPEQPHSPYATMLPYDMKFPYQDGRMELQSAIG
jgi:hypothetical protein